MNNARRKALENIIDMLNGQMMDLESVKDEEQECYDNLPEGIQNSERGEAMSENTYDLESIYDDLSDIVDRIQDIIDR